MAIEKKLIQSDERLFKLNALVFSLRFQMKAALAELALALATENPALIGAAEMKIQKIKTEQLNLDKVQRTLIQSTEAQTKIRTAQLQAELSRIGNEINLVWSFYIQGFTTTRQINETKMAVKPDSPDVAPAYELDSNYKQLQTVAYKWQQRFRSKSEAQDFLKSENIFEMSCSSTAEKKGSQWQILINADKF